MDRLNGVVLLICVCLLLAVVSGAVERGKVAGADYNGSFPFGNIGLNWVEKTTTQANTTVGTQTIQTETGGSKTNQTSTNAGNNGMLHASQFFSLLDFLPALPAWLLAAIAMVGFGGAFLLILRLKTSVHVLDLETTLEEMEQERKHLAETWSYKLRNAALLRYYVLMRRACLKVGLRDEPAETPQEYVGRVSSFFEVEKSEATKFASAVNRSRYGEELSELEAGEASRFMGAFADVIRRRAGDVR
jgi:hypothetical protein